MVNEDFDIMFDRDLQSIIYQPGFNKVKGLAIGRCEKSSKMTSERFKEIVSSKKELRELPVIANVDFGHTNPMITFPIGGTVKITSNSNSPSIQIVKH